MEAGKIGRLAAYGVAGIVGLMGANYLSNVAVTNASVSKYSNYVIAGVGAAALIGAATVIKDKGSWGGPARLLLALGGVVMVARGVAGITGMKTQLDSVTMNIL